MKALRLLRRDERGQALPIALMLLTLGIFYVIPTVLSTITNLVNQRVAKVHLVDEYSAEAGLTRAMWQLLSNNTASFSTTVNGTTVSVNVGSSCPTLPCSLVGGNAFDIPIPSDIHFTANDELWVVFTHKSQQVELSMYYDTFALPSKAIVPWQTLGETPYYFTNTPGSALVDNTGDAVENLTTINTRPSNNPQAFPDYDSPADGRPGRTIDTGNTGGASQQCADHVLAKQGPNLDPTQRIVWRLRRENAGGQQPGDTLPAGSIVKLRVFWTLDAWNGPVPSQELRADLCIYDEIVAEVRAGGGGGPGQHNPCDLSANCPSGSLPTFSPTDQFPWSSAYTITATAGGRTVTAGVDRVDGSNVETWWWQVQ